MVELSGTAIELSRAIHRDPELGLREVRASERLQGWLADEGFAVQSGVAGLATAFTATWGTGAPRIAVMMEYDALPDIGHACGHNLIAAGGAAAAIATRRWMVECAAGLPGTIVAIGTPGEEGSGGKVIELDAGVFDGVDAALMFHPSDRTVPNRSMLACIHLGVRFRGVAAHAAKNPEDGRSALSAMIQFFVAVDALRQHIGRHARLHGVITNGGSAANVIPDLTVADFYVRDATLEEATVLMERVRACAQGAALATETTVEVTAVAPPYAHLNSNLVMADRVGGYLSALGFPVEWASGTEATASTDAGNVSLAVPTVHPFVQVVPRGTPGHSVAMREAAGGDDAHRAMVGAAHALAELGVDLLTVPAFLRDVTAEFTGSGASS
jgi:amidohydrolase